VARERAVKSGSDEAAPRLNGCRIVLGGAQAGPAMEARRDSGERLAPGPLAKALLERALTLLGRGLVLVLRARPTHEAISVALLAAVVVILSGRVRASVEADVRYRVSKASLAASAPPDGLAPEAVQDLSRIGSLDAPRAGLRDRSFSVYWPESIATVAASYRALPWVREVRRVESFFPARLRFDLVVRRPVAGLLHQETTFLLDEEGVLLPRACYEPSDPTALRLPVIVNARLGRKRLVEGTRLEDVPVKHGIAVALGLMAPAFDPLRKGAVKIDVANVNFEVALHKPEVVVIAGTTLVEWGRSEAAPGQNLPLAEKIAHFAEVARARPLDRLSLVRLQFDKVEWREHPSDATARVE